MNMKLRDKRKVIEALRANSGMIFYASKTLGVTRQTLHLYIKKHPDLRELIDDFSCELVEDAEAVLKSALNDENLQAAMFVLRTLGKSKWSPAIDVSQTEKPPIPEIPIDEKSKKLGIEFLRSLTDANKK